MKRVFLSWVGVLAVAAAVSPAAAADLPVRYQTKAPAYAPVPMYNWSGVYIGINGGGGWGRSSHTDAALGLATGNFDVKGGLVGGTIGFNYQVGQWVWGLEGDIDWASIKGNQTVGVVNYDTNLRWLSTARGRIGYAWDRWLPYVTGGLAVGDVRGTVTTPATITTGTETRVGWTVGAGLEYAITPNVSIKGEYLYVDLGTATPVPLDSVDFKSHIVRGGLNWKFDWGAPVTARY